ncbi:unnamed protein product [Rhizoctonia solani]|uniref:F-box domain-containing protein n=1 Tax=Rhizoctonia solani TaxID=456999 RepID=A0A8H3A9Z9_9AGAM|nr:unnamed protein product [Rhizoctonia solani]
MTFLDILPTESIIHILLLLPPTDIITCKVVCHRLFEIIRESPELQYLLQLDILGYAPPLNPLNDLSFGDKIRVLQRKHPARPNQMKLQDMSPHAVKFESVGPLSANIRYSGGVLAVGKPSIDVTRQLQLYQLASNNKRTDFSSFVLHDLGVETHDFRFDPDLDLLVLLERVNTLADDDTDLEMRFHLRSLSTGRLHPLAPIPVLTSTFKFTTTYNEGGFQICGKHISVLCYTNSRLDNSSPKMCVWDWTTGELITSTEVPGKEFAFISENAFVVPASRYKWAGSDTIGSLLVYTITDTHPGNRARHIASLRLPATSAGPCHSQCHFIATCLPPSPIVLDGHPVMMPPKRVYEIGPSSHYLCLHIRAFNIENLHGQMANGMLFIPASSIHHILNSITNKHLPPKHYTWEDWASGTSWINTRILRRSPNCIFGHRAALLSFDHKERGWRVFLYDLRASVRGLKMEEFLKNEDEGPLFSDKYLNRIFSDAGAGIPGPTVVNSFLVSEGEEWDTHTDSIPPVLAVDDERIITYDERQLRGLPELHVYEI